MRARTGYGLIALFCLLVGAVIASAQCPGGVCNPWQQPNYPSYGAQYQSGYWNDPGSTCSESDVVVRAGEGGGTFGVGSGTVVHNGKLTTGEEGSFVLTNFHVVRVGDSGRKVSNQISVVVPKHKETHRARYVAGDPVHDLAVVFVPRRLRPVAVAMDDPSGGRTYYVSGWRSGRYFSRIGGRVLGRGNVVGATPGSSAHLSVPAQSGQSGGCLYDDQGCLAGVVWGCGNGQASVVVGTPLRNFLCRTLKLCCKPHSPMTEPTPSSPPQDSAQAPAPPDSDDPSPPAAAGASCNCDKRWSDWEVKQQTMWESVDTRFAKVETQLAGVESRMVPIENRVAALEARPQVDPDQLRSEVIQSIGQPDLKFNLRVRNPKTGSVSDYVEVRPGQYVTLDLDSK